MILTDFAILQYLHNEAIVIKPFDRECLGTNSYDVHLSEHIAEYQSPYDARKPLILDAKKENPLVRYEIPEEGLIMYPGRLYLGSTIEYTETHKHVPILEGKSSTGRLGIDIHATAGFGDVGFCGHWTLEISVKVPVKVYAGMPIGQLAYHLATGQVIHKYGEKKSAKYAGQNHLPQGSAMWKNFENQKDAVS